MEDIDINALGQAMDTSWGRSSTPKTSSYSIKISFQGSGRLLAQYCAVVNFGTERQMIDTKRRFSEESQSLIAAEMKNVKARYKELTSESISFDEVGSSDSLEIISLNIHNPKRTAYYRRQTVFEVT